MRSVTAQRNMQDHKEFLFDSVLKCLSSHYSAEQVIELRGWLLQYKSDVSALYSVASLFDNPETSNFEDKGRQILYALESETLHIRRSEKDVVFPRETALKAIQIMIDMLDDYLPLGSVVDLRKDLLNQDIPLDKVENIRFVITRRFACAPNCTAFFPYGGTIYPLSGFDDDKLMYFTPALVDRVVHTGFADEAELAYCAFMKNELVATRGFCSMGFADEEQRKLAGQSVNKAKLG